LARNLIFFADFFAAAVTSRNNEIHGGSMFLGFLSFKMTFFNQNNQNKSKMPVFWGIFHIVRGCDIYKKTLPNIGGST
jgi:hypothetical protein